MSFKPQLFLVFDVESIGLHGEGFCVGWTVVDIKGEYHAEGMVGCAPSAATHMASGTEEDFAWVVANVPLSAIDQSRSAPRATEHLPRARLPGLPSIARRARRSRAPRVEARFLARCIDDDSSRKWAGPYPLIDIASIRFTRGLDPLGTEERLPEELPEHSPLADAKQSARLLLEALMQ